MLAVRRGDVVTGAGHQVGRLRPDFGAGWADLECSECAATWVGPVGEVCAYCDLVAERSAGRGEDLRRAAAVRYVPGVLECATCGWLFADGPLLERAVCGVHGGPTACNGRLWGVRA